LKKALVDGFMGVNYSGKRKGERGKEQCWVRGAEKSSMGWGEEVREAAGDSGSQATCFSNPVNPVKKSYS
jgi:hypothetical protein